MSKETKWFIAAIVVIATLGLLLIWQPWPSTFRSELTNKIGEALLIAAILAVTVDQFSKRRLLADVARDIWTAIVGHPLPKEVQDYLKRLANTHLLRKDWDVKYTFSHTADREKLKVKVDSQFSLQNLSSTDCEYTQVLQLEKHDCPVVTKLACYSAEAKASYEKRAGGGEPSLAKDDDQNPGVLVAKGKKIWVRPNLDKPDIRYVVASSYEMELPINYSDVYSFGEPSLNVTVTTESPDDVEIMISPEEKQFASTVVTTKGRWDFRRLFTRGDHIRIRWRPKGSSPRR